MVVSPALSAAYDAGLMFFHSLRRIEPRREEFSNEEEFMAAYLAFDDRLVAVMRVQNDLMGLINKDMEKRLK